MEVLWKFDRKSKEKVQLMLYLTTTIWRTIVHCGCTDKEKVDNPKQINKRLSNEYR